MVDETPLERLKRASLSTYEQLYGNVQYFCRSHGLAIVAADVFAEDWVQTWQQLEELHIFLVEHGWQEEELVNAPDDTYIGKIRQVISTLCRLIVQNIDVELRSDETRLRELRINDHLSVGHADGTNNNCLVESLITVLTEAEFLQPLTAQQRRVACSMNRSCLVNHDNESLRPADEQGNKCAEALLEHDKHAEPTVRFLFAYCAVQGLVRPGNRNPENGFKLTVYSRADCNQIPASVVHICRGDTSSAEPYPLYLYNYLGERLRGVHYAPMQHLQLQAPMPQEEVDTPVPAAVAERERRRGRSAHGSRSAGSIATMCVPAFASGASRRCEAGSGTAPDEHATTRKRSFCSMLGCVPARATVTSAEGEGSEAPESSFDASEDSEEDGAGNHRDEDLCFEVQCRRDIRPEDMVERDLVRKRCLELRKYMRQRPDLPCNSA